MVGGRSSSSGVIICKLCSVAGQVLQFMLRV